MQEKEYMTLAEAAEFIGVKRATLYNYTKALKMKAVTLGPDGRRKFLARADVEKLKAYKEQPWTLDLKFVIDRW